MTKEIEKFLSEKDNEDLSINDYTWRTEEELGNNTEVMNEWLDEYLPSDYTLLEDSIDGTYAEILTKEGHKFACHASGNGDFFNHKISFELLEKAKYENQLINEAPPFRKETLISRDSLGWHLPAGNTSEASKFLNKSINLYGQLINQEETINTKEFANRIRKSEIEGSSEFANSMARVENMTFVVFDGDHRNSYKIDYQHSVIGTDLDNAEKLLDEIYENEIAKTKYKDGVERRASIFVSAGGELKSVVFVKEKNSIKNTPKY